MTNRFNLVTVFGVEKETKCKIVLGTFYTRDEATQFCEQWHWNYDDGTNEYEMLIDE